jgi:hypothetical protein
MRKNLIREGKGLLIFSQVAEVFSAEKALKKTYFCQAVVPPLKFRKGCDLALEIELVEQSAIEKILKAQKLMPLEIVALKDPATRISKLVDAFPQVFKEKLCQ